MEMRMSFHKTLDVLHQDLLEMGSLVEDLLLQAVQSLASMDSNLAQQVIFQDDRVDEMMLKLEERCLNLIALQQPMATDLRMIGTILKIVTDLERIADHAVDIAKTTLRLSGEKLVKPLVDIPRMAALTKEMLREALVAYVERNTNRAEELADKDNEVDKLYSLLFQEIIAMMGNDKKINYQLTEFLMVARCLERVADHATNIGEWLIYMVSGKRQDLNL
ncbi:phosphate signaling complex protein PhoU [Pelosinus sp. IPA-1]|uniref:phosphate signaling complex protein PhoU n=1 Tax=Pelosinus sp. IPA-1 TaxID=3029569 RepID=UPI00243615BB|nr:phosphate signaling complex protein PhoU [Pelosinus sp. IPA-1]GMB01014.1 phosphate transport system regulatory protein PhoU [Pelosinus sp. IPA-1]